MPKISYYAYEYNNDVIYTTSQNVVTDIYNSIGEVISVYDTQLMMTTYNNYYMVANLANFLEFTDDIYNHTNTWIYNRNTAKDIYSTATKTLLLQWGIRSGWGAITYPTAFSTTVCPLLTGYGTSGCYQNYTVKDITVTGFNGYEKNDKCSGFYWIAIGY